MDSGEARTAESADRMRCEPAAPDDGKRHGAHQRITDVLEVFYLPTETRVNAAEILRQSIKTKLAADRGNFPSNLQRGS